MPTESMNHGATAMPTRCWSAVATRRKLVPRQLTPRPERVIGRFVRPTRRYDAGQPPAHAGWQSAGETACERQERAAPRRAIRSNRSYHGRASIGKASSEPPSSSPLLPQGPPLNVVESAVADVPDDVGTNENGVHHIRPHPSRALAGMARPGGRLDRRDSAGRQTPVQAHVRLSRLRARLRGSKHSTQTQSSGRGQTLPTGRPDVAIPVNQGWQPGLHPLSPSLDLAYCWR